MPAAVCVTVTGEPSSVAVTAGKLPRSVRVNAPGPVATVSFAVRAAAGSSPMCVISNAAALRFVNVASKRF